RSMIFRLWKELFDVRCGETADHGRQPEGVIQRVPAPTKPRTFHDCFRPRLNAIDVLLPVSSDQRFTTAAFGQSRPEGGPPSGLEVLRLVNEDCIPSLALVQRLRPCCSQSWKIHFQNSA